MIKKVNPPGRRENCKYIWQLTTECQFIWGKRHILYAAGSIKPAGVTFSCLYNSASLSPTLILQLTVSTASLFRLNFSRLRIMSWCLVLKFCFFPLNRALLLRSFHYCGMSVLSESRKKKKDELSHLVSIYHFKYVKEDTSLGNKHDIKLQNVLYIKDSYI